MYLYTYEAESVALIMKFSGVGRMLLEIRLNLIDEANKQIPRNAS
jgi:hypothetical protein